MRRAVEELVDPSPRSVESLWDHFESRCAYCGKALSSQHRDGHVDHAVAEGGNHLGNLVLACGTCNGDEKREQPWQDFLRTKASGAQFEERESRILEWFELHARDPMMQSGDVARVRAEIDVLIESYAAKCGELKKLMSD